MATTDLPSDTVIRTPLDGADKSATGSVSLAQVLAPFASLRLTVALFVVSLILVFAGTLAQREHDIWYVIHNYFRCGLAWIEFRIFLPLDWNVPGKFPFPGGWTVGAALGINLLAAHALRFKVTGRGNLLALGLVLILLGSLSTFFVVQSGLGDGVESELSPAFNNGLWHGLRAALAGSTLLLAYLLALSFSSQRGTPGFWLWILGAVFCVLSSILTGWLFANPEARLDPSSLRILWQLTKCSAVGLVLLAGCYLVFGRRGGIVLLHGGIALLMFSELFTGLKAVEGDMQVEVGKKMTFAEDTRFYELAFVDKSSVHGEKNDREYETVVPGSLLNESIATGEVVDDPELPVKLKVVRWLDNCFPRLRQPGEESPATRGEGLIYTLESKSASTGVDQEQAVSLPGAYVELIEKDSEKSLGTYMLWAAPHPHYQVEPLLLGDERLELSLRLQRIHKDYAVILKEFRHDKYLGSSQAKNYSSKVELIDRDNQSHQRLIWMNNPVRYGGDTIYQASFDPSNPRKSTLQVVTNSGWMVPYVSCMIIAIGMLSHFGVALYRFAQRKTALSRSSSSASESANFLDWRSPSVWVPVLFVLICGGYALSKFRPPNVPEEQMQIHEFGKLPVAYQGRVQPLDTLARNALTVVCERESVVLPNEDGEDETVPAIRWLLDLIADSPDTVDYRCLRIDNLEVLKTLQLKRDPDNRYSLAELRKKKQEYSEQITAATGTPEEKRTLVQARFIRLANRVALINVIHDSFSSPLQYVGEPTFQRISAGQFDVSPQRLREELTPVDRAISRLNVSAPRVVPPAEGGQPWQLLLEAETANLILRHQAQLRESQFDLAARALRGILAAYALDDAENFNQGIADYKKIVAERANIDADYQEQIQAASGPGTRKTAETLSVSRLDFEAQFNHAKPFVVLMALYLIAFLLASGAWLGATETLNRSAYWLLWFTFILHTAALIGRIYISGRPPVTNLYSSAVFIGWAAVLFALVFESVYRMGVGNLLAAVVGFPTLYIAHNLAGDGDTFEVLQAVLDTQFWLATHVVCITLGYSTTFLAGALGLSYVVLAQATGQLDDKQCQNLTRMTYGTLCFATLFSFVGTILGGLWADDSWGRFWGWDPKENGALMIVIWNAIVLHARWGGMIQRRGMAVLVIFGNIVTAWSWFGVNAMGVGLHSYGFRAGMWFWLKAFVLSQLVFMLVGALLPDRRGEKPIELSSEAAI